MERSLVKADTFKWVGDICTIWIVGVATFITNAGRTALIASLRIYVSCDVISGRQQVGLK